jgi:hypothetical protein
MAKYWVQQIKVLLSDHIWENIRYVKDVFDES